MKHFFSCLAAAVLVCILFVGCTEKETSNDTTTASATGSVIGTAGQAEVPSGGEQQNGQTSNSTDAALNQPLPETSSDPGIPVEDEFVVELGTDEAVGSN